MTSANPTIILSLLVVLFFNCLAATGQTASAIAKTVLPSVVMIETTDEDGKAKSLGSGFFVRPDIVVTNYHVIHGASAARLKQMGSSQTYSIQGILGLDQTHDLALLSVKGVVGKALPLVTDSSQIEIGEDVYALGNPQGLEGTISPGIVSSKGLRQIGRENLVQITAPISPGSSGGPVVNKTGQVIGVASASLTNGQNLNFAVPAGYISILLNSSSTFLSFADFANQEKPSLKETTDWLTKTLSGLEGRSLGAGYVTSTSLTFDQCQFRYSWESPLDDGVLSITATGSMADFDRIGSAPGTIFFRHDEDSPVMFLDFTFKAESIDSFASNSRHRELDAHLRESSISIYLNDKRLRPSVEKAFLRLKAYCASQ